MRIERDTRGDVLLESVEVAARFKLPVEGLGRLMRMGLMTCSVEIGEDAGTTRLTLRCGNRAWRAILDDRDHVIREALSVEPARAKRPCVDGA